MPDKNTLTGELAKLARILSVTITILGAIWYFGKAPFKEAVTEIVDEYVEGNHFKVVHQNLFLEHIKSDAFEKRLDNYIEDNNSNTVSFRKILSLKMEVPEERVASEMANLYVKDKERLRNILRFLSLEYPGSNLWDVD